MGKLVLTMHTATDGFVATEDGKLWPAFGWPPEVQKIMNDLYREVTVAIFGRGVYEMVVPFWTNVAQHGIPEGASLGEVDLESARKRLSASCSNASPGASPRCASQHCNVARNGCNAGYAPRGSVTVTR